MLPSCFIVINLVGFLQDPLVSSTVHTCQLELRLLLLSASCDGLSKVRSPCLPASVSVTLSDPDWEQAATNRKQWRVANRKQMKLAFMLAVLAAIFWQFQWFINNRDVLFMQKQKIDL